jgi:hypothetical protein
MSGRNLKRSLVDRSALKDLLSSGLKRTDKILLILACDSGTPKQVLEILEIAKQSGLLAAKKWNISAILREANTFAIRSDKGWELNGPGKHHVSVLAGSASTPPTHAAVKLRAELVKIKELDTQAFVSEAIECYERRLYRAAVVLSWVGALSLLYSEVVRGHLVAFNAEALRRDPKWRDAQDADGLTRMKEHDFLDLIVALSVIGKSVKDELQGCLKLRNGCGHPNSLKIAEHRAASHIEILVLNVFSKFV